MCSSCWQVYCTGRAAQLAAQGMSLAAEQWTFGPGAPTRSLSSTHATQACIVLAWCEFEGCSQLRRRRRMLQGPGDRRCTYAFGRGIGSAALEAREPRPFGLSLGELVGPWKGLEVECWTLNVGPAKSFRTDPYPFGCAVLAMGWTGRPLKKCC